MLNFFMTTSDHEISYRKKQVKPNFDIASKIEFMASLQLLLSGKTFKLYKLQRPIGNQVSSFDVLKEKSFG